MFITKQVEVFAYALVCNGKLQSVYLDEFVAKAQIPYFAHRGVITVVKLSGVTTVKEET